MGFSLSDLDPKNVVESITGSSSLGASNLLKAADPVKVVRAYDRHSTRVLRKLGLSEGNFFQKIKFSRVAADRLRMADYGPVNLPAGGVAPLDALGSSAVTEGADEFGERVTEYLTADEIEAQKAAEAQAQADAEARRLAGQEELRRRRRIRSSGFIASGFGSVLTGYKTVLGV